MVAEAPVVRASWFVVIALGITQIIAWGSIYYAFALLIDPLAIAVSAGKATIVGAFSVALLIAGLLSSPIGALIDRYGGRWVMTIGSVAGALLLFALSYVNTVTQLYLVWACLGPVMAATLYDPAFAVLTQTFKDQQRKAITVLTLFGGFASTVFWPLTQALIQTRGWQDALAALALLNLLVCAPLHVLVLPRDSGSSLVIDHPLVGRAALKTLLCDPTFYGLCAAFTGNALVFSAMSVHLISLLNSKGLSLADAAWVGALIGPMQVLGRILEYVFLSKIPPSRVGTIAMWLLPTSLVLLAVLHGQSFWFVLFALLYGASNGVVTIVRGAIPIELYGQSNYGAVNGAMATPVLIAKAAGPILASLILVAFTNSINLILFLAAVGGVSALFFTITTRMRRLPS